MSCALLLRRSSSRKDKACHTIYNASASKPLLGSDKTLVSGTDTIVYDPSQVVSLPSRMGYPLGAPRVGLDTQQGAKGGSRVDNS